MSIPLRSSLRLSSLTMCAALLAVIALASACSDDSSSDNANEGSGGDAGASAGGGDDGSGGAGDGTGGDGSAGTGQGGAATGGTDDGSGGAASGGNGTGGNGSGGAGTGGTATGGTGTGGTGTEPAPECAEPAESLAFWWTCRMDFQNPQLSTSDWYAAMREEIHGAHGSNIGSLSWSIANPSLVGETFEFTQPQNATQPNYIHAYGDFPISTVEFWFKTQKSDARLVYTRLDGYVTRLEAGKLSVVFDDNPPASDENPGTGPYELNATKSLSDGKPHHVATTLDVQTRAFRLYVDGELADSLTLSEDVIVPALFTPGGELVMGGPNDPEALNPAASTYFTGAIDEVSLYTEALSSDAIADIYAAKLTGKCLHLPPAGP